MAIRQLRKALANDTLAHSVPDSNGTSFLQRQSRCQTYAQRLHTMCTSHRRRLSLGDSFREILQLRDVSLLEAFHKIRNRIMRHATFGQDPNWSFAQVADLQRSLCPQNFSADIVSV